MSNFGFIKKFRSQKSRDLKRDHLSAYLILDTIADYAKWDEEICLNKLERGEAFITASLCSLSGQQFETGLKYLLDNGYIKIIHKGRKDKKSEYLPRFKPDSTPDSARFKPRSNGTVVKLLDSSIWDLNLNNPPIQEPVRPRFNSGFTPNKEEIEEIRREELLIKEKAASQPNIFDVDLNDIEISLETDRRKHNIYNQTNKEEIKPEIKEQKETKVEETKTKPKQKQEISTQANELFEFFCKSIVSHLAPKTDLPDKKTSHYLDDLLKKHSSEDIRSLIAWAHTDAPTYYKSKCIKCKYLKDKYSEMLITKTDSKGKNYGKPASQPDPFSRKDYYASQPDCEWDRDAKP